MAEVLSINRSAASIQGFLVEWGRMKIPRIITWYFRLCWSQFRASGAFSPYAHTRPAHLQRPTLLPAQAAMSLRRQSQH